MTPSLAAAPQRRAYDHRLREQVCRTGFPALSRRLEIPRSTIATWKRRVDAHNSQMPHAAFRGQTPDEMYFGTAPDLTADLADARRKARERRLATNRGASCARCIMPLEPSVAPEIPP